MEFTHLKPLPHPLDVLSAKGIKITRTFRVTKKKGVKIRKIEVEEVNLLNVQWTIPGILPSPDDLKKLYEMKQGSPEWLAGRHRFLTSTVVVTIIGTSSDTSVKSYWQWVMREQPNKVFEEAVLRIMNHGTRNEDKVRRAFNDLAKTSFEEVGTIVCKEIPGMACNEDGEWRVDGKLVAICEIKCPVFNPYMDVTGDKRPFNRPPIKHFVQCQVNLNISGADYLYYIMCHIPNNEVSPYKRDFLKKDYYRRFLCKYKNIDRVTQPNEYSIIEKFVDSLSLADIPTIGLLYCIKVKRSQKFWNYMAATVKKFWHVNVMKFTPPTEEASTGTRDYDWFIKQGIMTQDEFRSLFSLLYDEFPVYIK